MTTQQTLPPHVEDSLRALALLAKLVPNIMQARTFHALSCRYLDYLEDNSPFRDHVQRILAEAALDAKRITACQMGGIALQVRDLRAVSQESVTQ